VPRAVLLVGVVLVLVPVLVLVLERVLVALPA
jgi:hypothetical protein